MWTSETRRVPNEYKGRQEDDIDNYLKDLWIDPCANDISLDFSIIDFINAACKYVEENSIYKNPKEIVIRNK